jgi:hypothetical protein
LRARTPAVVVSFWQVVSSFSGNLYVPWPSLYYALSNSLDVVSLQFLQLPSIACIQPDVSFLTVRTVLSCCAGANAHTLWV